MEFITNLENYIRDNSFKLIKIGNSFKLTIGILLDLFYILFSIYICIIFIKFELNIFNSVFLFFIFPISLICLYFKFDNYKNLNRFNNSYSYYKYFFINSIAIIFSYSIFKIFNFSNAFNFNYLLFLSLNLFSISLKIAQRDFLRKVFISKNKSFISTNTVIYGAGYVGATLINQIERSNKINIKFFVDDDPYLWGRNINGITIYPISHLTKNINKINQVIIALNPDNDKGLKSIYQKIKNLNVSILKIPNIELLSNKEDLKSLTKKIDIEDILGRGVIAPLPNLIEKSIENLNICISGAGGSIGGELCNQLLKQNPKKILLLEFSEHSLYKINLELNSQNHNNIKIIPILGDCSNESFLKKIITKEKIDIILHAAAYKHVPLVEINPLASIKNNIMATIAICKATENTNVSRSLLISSDKAVRPTNLMGATKRLCEMIFQAYAEKQNTIANDNKNYIRKKFSMVRFGNVLGSSGSVVPLFKKQIANGGPITITDKEITRYFMTLQEAAQLVLQALKLSQGGEVFLLDMGKPVKIVDLAKQMIIISGKTLKDSKNLDGDIEIKYTGLRPGEKLYEELLISAKSSNTEHPLIYKAQEDFLPYDKLYKEIEVLKNYLQIDDEENALNLISRLIPEWKRYKLKSS